MRKHLRLAALLAMAFAAPIFIQNARSQAPARGARPAISAPVVPSGPPLVDVNSADAKALDALPGVGPVRAKAIIAGRPYADKQDLATRKILPSNVFTAIEDRIALVNVNTASAADMAKILPNVGPVRAAAIVKARPFATPQEMVTKGALKQGVFEGIKGLVTAG
jgi:DNA uptake protein ComE-like DNA-binding protein